MSSTSHSQPRSVDGVYHPRGAVYRQRPVQPRTTAPPARQPKALPTRAYAKPDAKKMRSKPRIPNWLQILLAIPLLTFTSLFIQSAVLGQIAIVVYGIVAFAWRIPSKTTFSAALLSMVTTIVLLVVKGDFALAQNFATYTFLLLVVGVFTLSRELKKEGGRIYSRRPN